MSSDAMRLPTVCGGGTVSTQDVFFDGDCFEMKRICASSDSAQVVVGESVWDFSAKQFVRDVVSQFHLPVWAWTNRDVPVPVFRFSCGPYPASCVPIDVNLFEEAFEEWSILPHRLGIVS
jgi:hypothetical protein